MKERKSKRLWLELTVLMSLDKLDGAVHALVTSRLQRQFDYERDCFIEASVGSYSKRYELTLSTLLCNLGSAVLCQLILHRHPQVHFDRDCFISALVHYCAEPVFNTSLYRRHFAIWTLQCTCKWLCAFIANLIISETVSFHHQISLNECIQQKRLTRLQSLWYLESSVPLQSTLRLPGQMGYRWDCFASMLAASYASAWNLNKQPTLAKSRYKTNSVVHSQVTWRLLGQFHYLQFCFMSASTYSHAWW